MLSASPRLLPDSIALAPRLRGRTVFGLCAHHIVAADVEVRGRDAVRSVIVMHKGRPAAWGCLGEVEERLLAQRTLTEGARRFVLDAHSERIARGEPLGQLHVREAGQGYLAWSSETGRGLIADPAANRDEMRRGQSRGQSRGWIHDGVHRHLRTTRPLSWSVDDRATSLWLELDGLELDLQVEEHAAVGTLNGELGTFEVTLDEPTIDRETLLAYPSGGRIRGAALDITFCTSGQPAAGGPLSAIRTCIEVAAAGTVAGRSVRGRGILIERSAIAEPLEARFERAGQLVAGAVDGLVPAKPSPSTVGPLIGRAQGGPFMAGLDLDALSRSLFDPIRLITDRGGKAWRSYLMHLCGRACGGDMARHAELMAVPELIHVGSLIVDDVQDESEIRRGGPSCHSVFGTPLAINAGNAAYFLAELAIRRADLEPSVRQRVLELLFDGFRAGHAGQALDIEGLERQVEIALEQGFASLEERVLTIQWLKSGVPAGAFARMGAVVGGGPEVDEELVEALGTYFERVGTAFQIVDDVLNLRGFEGDLKQRGEDLSTAKVTLPLLACLSRMQRAEARATWEEIRARPMKASTLEGLCRRLERTGGIEAARDRALEMVEQAWRGVEGLLGESGVKVELRALGGFLLQRHY